MEQLGVESGFVIKIIILRRMSSYFKLADVSKKKQQQQQLEYVIYGDTLGNT